jgi:FeS assembly SUF system protein
MKQTADEQMVRNALGEEGYDELAVPPGIEADRANPLWKEVEAGLRDVFDPEIPVNIYELGLIYRVTFTERTDGQSDVFVEMTLTSPGCPVAQEMPGWVQAAILPIRGVGDVDVEIVWDPTWAPSMMAETAKLQLNMFT